MLKPQIDKLVDIERCFLVDIFDPIIEVTDKARVTKC